MFASRYQASTFAACLGLCVSVFSTVLAEPNDSKTDDSKTDAPRTEPAPWLVPRGRDTTFVDGPYAEDGLPDYVEALNRLASKGVTPENNAVVALVEVFGPELFGPKQQKLAARYYAKLGITPPSRDISVGRFHDYYDSEETVAHPETGEEEDIYDQIWRASRTAWSEKDLPLAAKALRVNQVALDRIVVASKRTHWYDPYLQDDSDEFWVSEVLYSALPQFTGRMHAVLDLLETRMLSRVARGKFDRAFQDVSAIFRFARFLDSSPSSLVREIASLRKESAGHALAAAMHHGRFDEKEVVSWKALWESERMYSPLGSVLTNGDRLLALNHLSRIARSPSFLFADLRKQVWFARVPIDIALRRLFDWEVMFRVTNHWFDLAARDIDQAPERLLDKHRATGSRLGRELHEIASSFDRRRTSSFLAESFAFFASDAITLKLEREKLCDLIDVSFALATYRARHAAYPESLKALGEAGKDIPGEAGGQLFRYERTEKGYRLWSRGQDGEFDSDTFDEDAFTDDVTLEVQ